MSELLLHWQALSIQKTASLQSKANVMSSCLVEGNNLVLVAGISHHSLMFTNKHLLQVAERIKACMPTSQELRKHRQREIARNGPSVKLASRAFGSVLRSDDASRRVKAPTPTETQKRARPEQPEPTASKTSSTITTTTTTTTTSSPSPPPTTTTVRTHMAAQASPKKQTIMSREPAFSKGEHSSSTSTSTTQQTPSSAPSTIVPSSSSSSRRPVFRLEVELEENCMEYIVVREGDALEDLVRDFGLQHDLTDEQIQALTDHLIEEFQKATAAS
eukprot:m.20023 g.20023  ORF g.20023 m.20023 type:complete len:274 (-) comp8797_c0_seq1:173-994(-)